MPTPAPACRPLGRAGPLSDPAPLAPDFDPCCSAAGSLVGGERWWHPPTKGGRHTGEARPGLTGLSVREATSVSEGKQVGGRETPTGTALGCLVPSLGSPSLLGEHPPAPIPGTVLTEHGRNRFSQTEDASQLVWLTASGQEGAACVLGRLILAHRPGSALPQRPLSQKRTVRPRAAKDLGNSW